MKQLAESRYEALPATLSEQERKQIFLEMSKAEYAAQRRGDYGDSYRDVIAKKHGLSRRQVNQIARDGIVKEWPIE